MKKSISIIYFLFFLMPAVALAQGTAGSALDTILQNVGKTLQTVIGLLFIVATVVFLWGVIMFIAKSGDETARSKAKGVILWGIIGLAVMAAAWGITNIIVGYFGVPTQGPAFRSFPTP